MDRAERGLCEVGLGRNDMMDESPREWPKVLVLIHGGPRSIERVRAEGMVKGIPEDKVRCLLRESGKWETARRWWQVFRSFRPDMVYVLNTASPGIILAIIWRGMFRVPYVLDTGDVIYEMAWRSGITPFWKRPFLWWFEWLGQHCASTIVVRGSRHRSYLLKKGLRSVHVVRDGYHPSAEVKEEDLSVLREKLGLKDYFVLGIMGSLVYSPRLNICYGWDLIEALAYLKRLPVKGLIIGDGNGMEWLKEKADRLGVSDRLVFTGRIPYEEVPVFLRLMDIAMSTQTNNLPGQVRTTGKLPEYMVTERFVLASRVGEAEDLLPDLMLVDFEGEVDGSYPIRLAERVRRLVENPELMEIRKDLPDVAKKFCDYQVIRASFQEVIREVAQGSK